MPARWSGESVLALAPDDSSRRAALALNRPARWDRTGAAGDLVWGLCAGSGMNPYQVIVDLAGPAYKCSCPSRKFPCKHALGLLLRWSAGTVPDEPEPADYARSWLETRHEKAAKSKSTSLVRTDPAGSSPAAAPGASHDGPGARTAAVKDEAAAARRAAERAQRVASGLADLQEWLRDQVRAGLASTGAGRAGPAESMAARMIDAQAPGVAAALRGLAAMTLSAGDTWPGRLLAEYAMLHLLARAHERSAALPDGLTAVVRSRVGYPVGRDEVLAGPAVPGHWLVVAVRELTDAAVPARRIWLRDADTGRWGMLLTFAVPGGAWQDPDTARLRPGTEVHADLHYYPGQPPLRALVGTRHGGPLSGKPPVPADGVSGLLAEWAASLALDPWLTYWPVLLSGTPVPPGQPDRPRDAAQPGPPDAGGAQSETLTRRGWRLIDEAGNALPLADRESLWTLLAVSGGRPVTVAGEWHPDGLLAMTTWYGDAAVTLDGDATGGPGAAAADRSGQADMPWDALVTAATVGVTRKGLAVSELGWPVAGHAKILDAADPAAALLDAAALLTVARRAGVQPIRAAGPAHDAGAAPAGQDRELSARAARLLRRIGQAKLTPNYAAADTELLADLLTAARDAGYVVPAPLLPGLLDAAVRKKELRPVLVSVLGARGRWLAAQRPDWRQLLAQADANGPAEDSRVAAGSPPPTETAGWPPLTREEHAADLLMTGRNADGTPLTATAALAAVAACPVPWPPVLTGAAFTVLRHAATRETLTPLTRGLLAAARRCLPAIGDRDYAAELIRLADAYPQDWSPLLYATAETIALRRAFLAELR